MIATFFVELPLGTFLRYEKCLIKTVHHILFLNRFRASRYHSSELHVAGLTDRHSL